MKQVKLTAILLSLIAMVSCQKNITDPNVNPKLPTVGTSAPLFTNALSSTLGS